MQIISGESRIDIKELYHETRTVNGTAASTIKIMLDGPITEAALAAVTSGNIVLADEDGTPVEIIIGYTHTHEHYLVLVNLPISQAEAEDMRAALGSMGVQKGVSWMDGAEAIKNEVLKAATLTPKISE